MGFLGREFVAMILEDRGPDVVIISDVLGLGLSLSQARPSPV